MPNLKSVLKQSCSCRTEITPISDMLLCGWPDNNLLTIDWSIARSHSHVYHVRRSWIHAWVAPLTFGSGVIWKITYRQEIRNLGDLKGHITQHIRQSLTDLLRLLLRILSGCTNYWLLTKIIASKTSSDWH